MRTFNWKSLLPSLLLVLLPTSIAITLSDFQQVAGFSKVCTDAYDTPLTACTSSDFADGHACSLDCINFLKDLTIIVNKACKGTKAFPETLIGMMFSGDAVAGLCPNALALTSSKPSGIVAGGDGGDGEATATISTVCSSSLIGLTTSIVQPPTTETAKASTIIPSSSLRPIISAAGSSTLEPIVTSTAVFMISTTIDSDPEPTVLPLTSTIPLSVLTAGSSSTATGVAKPTPSSQKQKNNPEGTGGGTLFDITSSSCHNAKFLRWLMPILAGGWTLVCIV